MNLKQQMAIAMMAALTGVMGVVPSIPIGPVPITIQSIAPMLAGGILGAKRGAASMMLFLLLVACSVPILSGGRGGVGHLFGPTGGYLFGWILVAFLVGCYVTYAKRVNVWKLMAVNIIVGMFILYGCGALYLSQVTATSVSEALLLNIAFIPGDTAKAVLAAFIAVRVRRALGEGTTEKVMAEKRSA